MFNLLRVDSFIGLESVFPDVIKGIRILHSPKRIYYKRSIYNTLDLIGDVGGLLGGLNVSIKYLVYYFNSSHIVNSLFTKLFLIKTGDSDDAKADGTSIIDRTMMTLRDIALLKPMGDTSIYFLLIEKFLYCKRFKNRRKPIKMAKKRL